MEDHIIVGREHYQVGDSHGEKIYYLREGHKRTASTICCVSGRPLADSDQGAIAYCLTHGWYSERVLALINRLLQGREEKDIGAIQNAERSLDYLRA